MDGDRSLILEAFREVISFEQASHGVAPRQADNVLEPHLVEPFRVEADLRLFRIEDLEYLSLIGFGVSVDIVASHRRACNIASRRIADQARHVTDKKDYGMAKILEVLHFPEQNGMTQMQIRRGRVEACLHAQRPPER
jgi:hypothetical protein